MRVVHVESGRHLYGGAAQVRDLVAGLEDAGLDNVLVCAAGGRLAALPPAALGGARVVALPMRGDLDLGLPARLRRVFRALEPDLVHVHSRRGAELAGGLAAALAGVPAVLTRRVESREPALALKLKCRPYRAVISISSAVEKELARAGVPAERVVRIPSAVDTARFAPDARARARLVAAAGLPADALIVGVVAQLIERKGHAALLGSLPQLVAREPRLHVLCIGQGPLEPRLRALAAATGLDERVRWLGFRDDLADLLPGLDVLAHPAEREGLGLAVREAMSAGVAVVASAAGGLVDSIEDGVDGLLAPPGDAAAFAAALARASGDGALRERLGGTARTTALRRFSVAALVARHVELYVATMEARSMRGLTHGRAV